MAGQNRYQHHSHSGQSTFSDVLFFTVYSWSKSTTSFCLKETVYLCYKPLTTPYLNKKVLLRDRKRHTARRVESTDSAVLSRVGGGGGGLPSPVLARRVPLSWGTPQLGLGYHPLGQEWGTPWGQASDTPQLGQDLGTPQKGPQTWGWSIPAERTWIRDLGKNLGLGYPNRKDLGPETWERIWDWGTPPHVNRQTDACENITFPSYYVRGR